MAAESEPAGYRAFISYSHKDVAWARWLHARLESYRLPRRLVGQPGAWGAAPARLTPIFRDRDELPAAGDLSEQVRAALARSATLVVICSPHAAASPWVAREIELFRMLHPDRPILTAVIAGEPGQWFPAPLVAAGADGRAIEPLAADLRPAGDGKRLGLLKLIAGITGVALDSLVQRDAQRKLRRVTAVTVGALFGMLAMGLLALVALDARAEAERQRGQAEGLIEFMLTDLRERLKGVGRLDVLTAVNERALGYYGSQEALDDLPVASLERRARILHAMGEDDGMRGDNDAAEAKFREAHRTTAVLLDKHLDDPNRIYAHAQSEYWVGYANYVRGDRERAKSAFERYKTLANRLVAIDGGNPDWLKEAAYAEGNLCTIALKPPVDKTAALRSCTASLANMEGAVERANDPRALWDDLANRHAWLADAHHANGDDGNEWSHRRSQERLLHRLRARDPKNMDWKDMWLALQIALAKMEIEAGATARAKSRLAAAEKLAGEMIRSDPSNTVWADRRSRIQRLLSQSEKGG